MVEGAPVQISKAYDRCWPGGRPRGPQLRRSLQTDALWGTSKIARYRTTPLNLESEAHLAPWKRAQPLVRYMRGGKRHHAGRAIVLGCLLLNELRGLFVVAAVLKAWHG